MLLENSIKNLLDLRKPKKSDNSKHFLNNYTSQVPCAMTAIVSIYLATAPLARTKKRGGKYAASQTSDK